MRTRLTALALTGTAAVLAAGLSAAPSLALTAPPPWTITPGGAFTAAHIGSIVFRDTVTGATITCTNSNAAGTLLPGSTIPGPVLGTIKKIPFISCALPPLGAVTVTAHALPWTLNGVSYNAGTGVTHGTITGIDITLASPACSADLDGTAAAANDGSVDVTYTNPRKLKILPAGGTLNAYNVTGCPGFSTSDPVAVTGAYKLTAPQSIS